MALSRFGAAASAWETLHRGYSEAGDNYNAQQAATEAVRLHASAGRIHDARNMLRKLRAGGASAVDIEQLNQEIDHLYSDFEQSVQKIGAARDYAQLYNQLVAQGEVIRAWRFRLQADASLAAASSRAMYRRQPDVLVELYKSNDSMDRALASLNQADLVFRKHGMEELAVQSRELRGMVR